MKGRAFITLFAITALALGCSNSEKPAPNGTSTTGTTATTATTGTTGSAQGALKELKTEDLEPGKGPAAEEGDTLTMLYRGKLANGTVFDGNMDDAYKPLPDKDPFPVALGMGMVIKGWDKGLIGIKVGGVRKISVPPDLGYGPSGSGQIPPNADLYFTVKCLDIVKKGEEMVIDTNDVKVGSGAEVKKGDKVTVHYVGKLLSDKQFDSSRDPGKSPYTFTVGAGEVVPGFDKGVLGMKKGGLRKVRIPPQAAYGANPQGGIPPNSVLMFEIEVLKINGK
jgi:peptidylprolyl isomerase